MADYHRFVAYIYEYVNGKKMQNTGFAKIELRNAICRIQIHIQNIRMLDGKTEVFGIVRQPKESRKNNPIILLIGEGQTQGSGFDRRFTVPEEPFVEESCRFEQVCGIYIRSQSGRNWMTVFDDEPIAIENLGKPEEIKAETDEENVKKSETDKETVEENETDKENVGIKENEKSEKSTESEADQELQEENINLDITEHVKAELEITAEEMQEEIFSKEVSEEIPEKVSLKDRSEKIPEETFQKEVSEKISQELQDAVSQKEKPKETDEEKVARAKAMEEATIFSIEVPYKTAKLSLEALQLLDFLVANGNQNAITDIGVGTLMLATGMEGAILNVKVNLMGLENKEIHDKYSKGCKEILCEGQKIKDDIIAKIHKQLD